jgi:hypothetical protein
MLAFRSVVSVLLRALGDFSLHPQGRPCGRPATLTIQVLASSAHALPGLARERHHQRPDRLKAARRASRRHRIEPDRVSGDPIVEGDVGKLLADDDKGTVIHDFVGSVINLIALRIFGAELTISGEKVRMHVWYGAFAWLLRVGDLVGGGHPGQVAFIGDDVERDLLAEPGLGEDLPAVASGDGPSCGGCRMGTLMLTAQNHKDQCGSPLSPSRT